MKTNKIENDKLPIVVVRSNDNCFLDVIRCCGVEDIPVIPVIYNWNRTTPWLSEKSKYFKNPIEIECPSDNEELATKQMCEIGKNTFSKYNRKLLIIPSSDTTLLFLQRNYKSLFPYFLQMGSLKFNQPFLNIFSKYEFAKVLSYNKIPTPVTLPCFEKSQVEDCVKKITYPCIYKPVTKDLTNSFPSKHKGLKAIINYSEEELRENLLNELSNGYCLIVQEYIKIEDNTDEITAYLYVGEGSNPKWTSAQLTLNRHPEIFGTGYLGKNIINHELTKLSIDVAKALNWRGFMSVEFKRDPNGKGWKIIEANFRPWLSIYFQTAIGHNYIKDLYEDVYGISIGESNQIDNKSQKVFYKINMFVLIEKIIKESKDNIDFKIKFNKWFEQHPGNYVFSTYHELDKEPALFEIELLITKYPEYIEQITEIKNRYLYS
jgi:predicted ATP-grasp superfamily ATP-dependent carboligase